MKKSFLFISCFAAAMAFSAAAVAAVAPPSTTLALQSPVAVAKMSATSHAVVLVATAATVDLAVFAQDVLPARERMPAESLVAQVIAVVARGPGNRDVSLNKTGTHAEQEAEGLSQAPSLT